MDDFEQAALAIIKVAATGDAPDTGRDKTRDRQITYAAFEVMRQDVYQPLPLVVKWFYRLFLVMTTLSPFWAVLVFDRRDRNVGWDEIAVVSTVLLLSFTYGLPALQVIWFLFGDLTTLLRDTWFPTAEKKGYRVVGDPHDIICAVESAIGLMLGGYLSCVAIVKIFSLQDRIQRGDGTIFKYHAMYVQFFVVVLAISLLFFLLDAFTAVYERSHARTSAAAASMVCATGPVFIGLSVVGAYLWAAYLHDHYVEQQSYHDVMTTLPIDFAAGALAFQLIVSNILFVFIKTNCLTKAAYATVHHTRRL